MPSRNQKKISKQRAEYLQKQDDILSQENKAKARARYKADPEKKKASVRDSYKADPENKKASVRDSYKADPENKKASVRDSYKADPENKKASVRDSYKADPENKKASVRDSYKADPENKKASVRDSYKADPENKKASVRDSYKADPENKKASADPEKKKASVRDNYKADPEKKKASVRDSYKADPEKKKASVRDSYNADIESISNLLKGSDIKRTSRRTALLKGINTRTIQLPLRHLKGIGIGMTPLSDWLNVLPRGSGIAGVTELPLPPKDAVLPPLPSTASSSSAAPTASSSKAALTATTSRAALTATSSRAALTATSSSSSTGHHPHGSHGLNQAAEVRDEAGGEDEDKPGKSNSHQDDIPSPVKPPLAKRTSSDISEPSLSTLTTSTRHVNKREAADKEYLKNVERMKTQYAKRKRHQCNTYTVQEILLQYGYPKMSGHQPTCHVCCAMLMKLDMIFTSYMSLGLYPCRRSYVRYPLGFKTTISSCRSGQIASNSAHLGVHVEVGSNLTPDGSRSRPADVLVRDWITGRFAAFDFTVSSPLSVASLNQACITSGFAALSAETRKHKANDPKCSELGWVCVPLAVETYGNWGKGLGTHFPV
ncbi:hypothetical protein EMCRGX_G028404 [Ephydatia muelleri]